MAWLIYLLVEAAMGGDLGEMRRLIDEEGAGIDVRDEESESE
jgi:hypothetical protein